jgi:hypothetical protein
MEMEVALRALALRPVAPPMTVVAISARVHRGVAVIAERIANRVRQQFFQWAS